MLAGAHLLVLLQWIVFLQDKQVQQYWWIFALSIPSSGRVGRPPARAGLFGILLLVYLLLSMWSLSVFSLYLGTERFHEEGEGSPDERPGASQRSMLLPYGLAVAGNREASLLGARTAERPASSPTPHKSRREADSGINGRFVGAASSR